MPSILIVDDEPLIRMMLVEAFEDHCVAVHEAEDAEQAWAMLLAGTPIDLVFSDHSMPGCKTGTALISDIRERFPNIKTALASGFMSNGPEGVMLFQKPYNVAETVKALVNLARS